MSEHCNECGKTVLPDECCEAMQMDDYWQDEIKKETGK